MSNRIEYIILPWEIELYIQHLQISELEDIGTKGLIFLKHYKHFLHNITIT